MTVATHPLVITLLRDTLTERKIGRLERFLVMNTIASSRTLKDNRHLLPVSS